MPAGRCCGDAVLLSARRHRAGPEQGRQDRRAGRHVRPLRREHRAGRCRRGQVRDRRFRRLGARQADRARERRLPEQGRCRRRHRQALVRRRECRPGDRHPQLGDRARPGQGRRGEEPHRHADRGGDLGADRQGLRSQQHPLDLRHLRPDQDHRERARQAGRRQLVLHHRRLRLRPRDRAGRHPASSRRRAARCWARCAIR